MGSTGKEYHQLLFKILAIVDANESERRVVGEVKDLIRAAFEESPLAVPCFYPKLFKNDVQHATRVVRSPEEEAQLHEDIFGTWVDAGPAEAT